MAEEITEIEIEDREAISVGLPFFSLIERIEQLRKEIDDPFGSPRWIRIKAQSVMMLMASANEAFARMLEGGKYTKGQLTLLWDTLRTLNEIFQEIYEEINRTRPSKEKLKDLTDRLVEEIPYFRRVIDNLFAIKGQFEEEEEVIIKEEENNKLTRVSLKDYELEELNDPEEEEQDPLHRCLSPAEDDDGLTASIKLTLQNVLSDDKMKEFIKYLLKREKREIYEHGIRKFKKEERRELIDKLVDAEVVKLEYKHRKRYICFNSPHFELLMQVKNYL